MPNEQNLSRKHGLKRKRQAKSGDSPQSKMSNQQSGGSTGSQKTESVLEQSDGNCLKSILDSLNLLHAKFDDQNKAHEGMRKEVFGEQGMEPRLTTSEAQCDDNTSDISDLKGKYSALKKRT